MTKTAKYLHKVEILNLIGEKECNLTYKSMENDKPVIESLNYQGSELTELVLENLMFQFCELDDSQFNTINIKNTDMFGVICTDGTFANCIITDSIIYACTLYGSIFKTCTFESVVFRGVNLAESLFENCTFNNCKFISDHINHFTDLTDAQFINCSVLGTVFDDIDISENTILPKIGKQ